MPTTIKQISGEDKTAHVESPELLLEVKDLWLGYRTRKGIVPAVRKVNLALAEDMALGLVGESGCGKSTLAYAVMHYLGHNGMRLRGEVRYRGNDLADLSGQDLRALRGREIAMVYQDPTSCLNPVLTIGEQLMEIPIYHEGLTREEARLRALEALDEVHIPNPASILGRYLHQLSGGQQQRVLIAMALIGKPSLLVMDEPTTGLDVTIEAAILDLVAEIRRKHSMAMLFISHNLGTVLRICDRVGVMYSGELVEEGDIEEVFKNPRHPYTRGLLDCLPTLEADKTSVSLRPIKGQVPAVPRDVPGCVFAPRCEEAEVGRCTQGSIPTLCVGGGVENTPDTSPKGKSGLAAGSGNHQVCCVRAPELSHWHPPLAKGGQQENGMDAHDAIITTTDLHKRYERTGGHWFGQGGKGNKGGVKALNGVSLEADRSRTLAIVGESGCGKSTLARTLTGLEKATGGSMRFNHMELAAMPVSKRPFEIKRAMQMVFQHPDGTLNPSHTIGHAITRALKCLTNLPKKEISKEVEKLLLRVNLPIQFSKRLPRQLSGGQKQRVAIARVLAGNPSLIIADEPVSALDVSVQAAILNLLLELQYENKTTLIFISHDLAVVRFLADKIAVMYLGQIMETGTAEAVFNPPYHPYTQALLSAAPDIHTKQKTIHLQGDLPNPANPPPGCPFQTRCHKKPKGPDAQKCEQQNPELQLQQAAHYIACHLPKNELGKEKE